MRAARPKCHFAAAAGVMVQLSAVARHGSKSGFANGGGGVEEVDGRELDPAKLARSSRSHLPVECNVEGLIAHHLIRECKEGPAGQPVGV